MNESAARLAETLADRYGARQIEANIWLVKHPSPGPTPP
jgi:hypothetical protein